MLLQGLAGNSHSLKQFRLTCRHWKAVADCNLRALRPSSLKPRDLVLLFPRLQVGVGGEGCRGKGLVTKRRGGPSGRPEQGRAGEGSRGATGRGCWWLDVPWGPPSKGDMWVGGPHAAGVGMLAGSAPSSCCVSSPPAGMPASCAVPPTAGSQRPQLPLGRVRR